MNVLYVVKLLGERVAYARFYMDSNPAETRRLHVGFAWTLRHMNRASGIVRRDAVEEAAGPAMKVRPSRSNGDFQVAPWRYAHLKTHQ